MHRNRRNGNIPPWLAIGAMGTWVVAISGVEHALQREEYGFALAFLGTAMLALILPWIRDIRLRWTREGAEAQARIEAPAGAMRDPERADARGPTEPASDGQERHLEHPARSSPDRSEQPEGTAPGSG